ncbi:MAG TPA: PAS domain S-box protein [Gaiellaceae bacterium]
MRHLLSRVGRAGDAERRLLDAIPLATVAFGADASILRWNRAAEELFGWTAEEVIGRRNPIVPPADRESAHENHQRMAAAGGDVRGLEVVRVRRDGTPVEVSVFATPLPPDAGPPGGYLVVYEEIGERKRVERERAEAQREYRELVEALPLVSYVDEVAPGAPNLYTSPQVRDLLGWEPSEWREDPRFLEKLLHPDDRDRVLALIDGEAFTHEPVREEYRLRHRDGHYVWVRDQSSIVVGEDGRALSRGFLIDITEEKRLEAQLLQSQKMEALGQLAGGIAHDFNNLLTGIAGYADLASETTRNPSVARCLDGIRTATGEAASLTARLLAFSRRDVPARRPVDLNELVRGAADLLERIVREDVRLVLELSPRLPPVAGDPAQLKQVVLNLALNARDAMPGGGSLRIATSTADGRVVLRVADSGHGMDEQTRQRALEPFFTTKPDGEGTGLGLAVVYGVVSSGGGTIAIRSEPGAGTVVTVELPATAEAVGEDGRPLAEPPAVEGDERVLVVEDREIVRELACSILAGSGYVVRSAHGGPEALELVESEPPFSLVLTDVVMPDMSGAELAGKLRATRPDLRVLYMSGYTADVLGPDELQAPHTGFLRKPFGTAELTAAVRDLLLEPTPA